MNYHWNNAARPVWWRSILKKTDATQMQYLRFGRLETQTKENSASKDGRASFTRRACLEHPEHLVIFFPTPEQGQWSQDIFHDDDDLGGPQAMVMLQSGNNSGVRPEVQKTIHSTTTFQAEPQ